MDSEPATVGGDDGMPEASFLKFLSGFGHQALVQLGALPHPESGERSLNLPFARYSVAMLQVFAEKTAGNLSDEERSYLTAMIADLGARLERLEGDPG